jgi:hypothetical protein|tara:strand:- start:40 stop:732 length:693 start_codon:yes stop_codon:yes gene_type:complete
MPTWADILKLHFENTDTEAHNFGQGGAGNYYIFNTIVEKSLEFNFTKDDLILIQWSGVFREDRFKDGHWYTPGNILTQPTDRRYSKEVVRDWFFDEEGMTKRDYSYIHSIQKMLEADDLDYEMFSMNGLEPVSQYYTTTSEAPVFSELTTLYHDTLIKLHPSMYEIIWGSVTAPPPKRQIKARISKENPGGYDQHPLPTEHLSYLEKVFQFKPSDELRTYVDKITKELLL